MEPSVPVFSRVGAMALRGRQHTTKLRHRVIALHCGGTGAASRRCACSNQVELRHGLRDPRRRHARTLRSSRSNPNEEESKCIFAGNDRQTCTCGETQMEVMSGARLRCHLTARTRCFRSVSNSCNAGCAAERGDTATSRKTSFATDGAGHVPSLAARCVSENCPP